MNSKFKVGRNTKAVEYSAASCLLRKRIEIIISNDYNEPVQNIEKESLKGS